MSTALRIALLVETSREYGRGLLRGIIRYQQQHGPWSLYFKPQGLDAAPPPWLNSWRGDGILARINDRRMARAVAHASVPVVDVRNALPDLSIPTVGIENQAVVQLAMEHFSERGFRHFAFFGTPQGENRNQDDRADLFAALVRKGGFVCHSYVHESPRPKSWDAGQTRIVRWLKRLPTPVAVLTCHDDCGQQVIDACLRANLSVPDQVAVLGVDNDPFLCNLCTPQLSSIDVDPERIGYEAAKLLDRLIQGAPAPAQPLLFPPKALVVRRSTDVTAVTDPYVGEACRLIRDHAGESVNIDQLLAQIPISRSSLFRRFKTQLGRSPKKELTRVRMARARELLIYSRLGLEEVARQAFRSDVRHFISAFRKETGVSPMRYRKAHAF